MAGTDNAASVDEALKQFTDMMAADGYVLSWSPTDEDRIVVRIDATADACADCLVPQPVMEAIMASALEPTPYRLDHVVLPGHAGGASGSA
ncbi:hypothetical protein [Microbacterium album]|uniref:Uncharacterized protein n=1 Tax=Microbacterium album TaxID=2053191 RepID=A0A917MLH6_9MICO|nr:hypothetical protein [Microbacterium album]GGH40920.1 hypothetical protein GCM10010921_13170 [Microbacterium album]